MSAFSSSRFLRALVVAAFFVSALPVSAETIRLIEFPVAGLVSYGDDFGDPRGGGRLHEGIDIVAAKMTPAVSAIDGEVAWITEQEASWGWAVTLRDVEGYTYHYLHLNNDTPGSDDGLGGRTHAIAPGIERGVLVRKGQLVGWVGDSGNAEKTAPHLHFEIREPNDTPINPFQSLRQATSMNRFVPVDATAASPTINADRALAANPEASVYCVSGALIRSTSNSAVYYCGADGKRYVFPNQKTFATWYKDFSGVQMITGAELANIPIGGNVTYRPGVKLVKIQSDPKIYAVDRGGTLRWVVSAEVAKELYGTGWAKQVEDVSDSFFVNYKTGEPVLGG